MAAKKAPPAIVWEYHYSICVDTNVTLRDGVEWYAPTSRIFKPRNDVGDAACKACLDVWNSEIVPVTTIEMGARYRYSVDVDWRMGNGEWTEFRYSDDWIRFDLRLKKPKRLRNSRPEPVRLPKWLVAGARLTPRRSSWATTQALSSLWTTMDGMSE